MNFGLIIKLLVLTLVGGVATQACAGAFSVTPVRIFMGVRDKAVAVTLVNEGNYPVTLQAELVQWNQDAQGQERLEPTEDLVLSPPIIELAPQSRQVVRLARLSPPDLERQQTYRLIVREVPEIKNAEQPGLQIPIALALSIPVFISSDPMKRQLDCKLVAVGLQCRNNGNAYAQLREVIATRESNILGRFEGGSYILPGALKTIPLSWPKGVPTSGPVTIEWLYDDGQRQRVDTTWP
jgi:fimbrial chaperone protein